VEQENKKLTYDSPDLFFHSSDLSIEH